MDQMFSFNAKLELLKQTRALEEKEKERAAQSLLRKNNQAENIRVRNAELSKMTHTELMFRREEAERRLLISKMKEYAEQLGLSSITDILTNYEGISLLPSLFYIVILYSSFLYDYYYFLYSSFHCFQNF